MSALLLWWLSHLFIGWTWAVGEFAAFMLRGRSHKNPMVWVEFALTLVLWPGKLFLLALFFSRSKEEQAEKLEQVGKWYASFDPGAPPDEQVEPPQSTKLGEWYKVEDEEGKRSEDLWGCLNHLGEPACAVQRNSSGWWEPAVMPDVYLGAVEGRLEAQEKAATHYYHMRAAALAREVIKEAQAKKGQSS